MPPTPRRILALSGSLRARSVNTAVLLAAQSLAPAGCEVALFGGVGDLPHFNPDLDTEDPPRSVATWRDAVAGADALLICTPEYAHGLPGALKNALDWLVSFEGFIRKPVAIFNARPGGDHERASLREILSVMNAHLLADACVTLPLMSNTHDAASLLAMPAVRAQLESSLAALGRSLLPGKLQGA